MSPPPNRTDEQPTLFDPAPFDDADGLPVVFPVKPLLDWAALRGWSAMSLRQALGVSGTTWAAAKARGITPSTADRWAASIGEHPSALWPDW